MLASRGEWRTFYFAFNYSPDVFMPPLVRWFTRHDRFSHVMPFCQQDERTVLVMDWLRSHLSLNVWQHPQGGPYPAEWVVWDLASQGYTVVRLTRFVSAHNPKGDVSNCYSSCVMFAKRLIGITGWIGSPQQFYRWLLTNGGHEYTQADLDNIREITMGSFGGGNKGAAQANSQAQKQLNEQKRLNDVQIGNLNAETAKLAQQRQAAEAEAARIADENQRKKDLIAKRNGGRTSLIATSELGLADTLG
jgi:hypothetical protein